MILIFDFENDDDNDEGGYSEQLILSQCHDGPSGNKSTCQCGIHSFNPWVGKIPWRRK